MAYLSLIISESDLMAIKVQVEEKKSINKSDYVRQAIREKLYRDMGARPQ
jgi:Arc/MetJ-type ribon-helix-helix transcriptional regulator